MKILIIQQKMIGDVLTSSILFEAIKNKYPDSKLHYLINTHTFPVVENNPHIDHFVFFTKEQESSKIELFKLAKQLRKENYDVVIDVYSKFSSNLIVWFSKSKKKISKHKTYTSFLYTDTFKDALSPKTNAGLAIENRLQLLQPLGIEVANIIKPKIYLTDSEKENARSFLKRNHIDLQQPLYMIGVLGSEPIKTYPYEYMAKVIDQIADQQPNSQLLFNYMPKQEVDAKAILNLCSTKTQKQIYFKVFGKGLRDFLAITSHCNALIGNEGGATNMAKALKIPTFTIFSPWIKKEAWNMFDDGKKHVSVHLRDFEESPYAHICHPKELKNKAQELYSMFSPSFFRSQLNAFLKEV